MPQGSSTAVSNAKASEVIKGVTGTAAHPDAALTTVKVTQAVAQKKMVLFGLQLDYWIWVVIILAVLGIAAVVRFILKRVEQRFNDKQHYWLAAFIGTIFYPVLLIILLQVFESCASHFIVLLKLNQGWINDVVVLSKMGTVVAIAWFLLRWKNRVLKTILMRREVLASRVAAIHAITKVFTIAVIVLTVMMVMNILQIKMTAILTVGGVGAAAFAFAAKDVIANLFGGLVLYMTSPFRVGDTIQVPNREIEGSIEEVGWYLTVIRNFDKQPIYVPNALFGGAYTVNVSRMSHRRINLTLGLRYRDIGKVTTIAEQIKTMLDEHPRLDKHVQQIASLDNYGDFSVNMTVMGYTQYTSLAEYRDIRQDVLLKIAEIVQNNGADFAFPTQTVDLPERMNKLFVS